MQTILVFTLSIADSNPEERTLPNATAAVASLAFLPFNYHCFTSIKSL